MLSILVTGANGQLGSDIQALSSQYPYKFFFADTAELDITNADAIEIFITQKHIDTIINCAAYTAVDKAESDAEMAYKVNHTAVTYLSQIAKKYHLSLIHISTDYVFDGKNFMPYMEDSQVQPNSIYGASKLEGERSMQAINPQNSIIIRTSWVYSSYGQNFVKTMLRLGKEKDSLGVIFDQVGTPTYAKDLAETILKILPELENSMVEIYNYSNEGVLSWYDFAKEIMLLGNLNCQINPIETIAYPTPAKRPHYSLLNKKKIKEKFKIEIPYWKDSLRECLQKMGAIQ
jgi:dTDP-4-dehydrorhamnose reductase